MVSSGDVSICVSPYVWSISDGVPSYMLRADTVENYVCRFFYMFFFPIQFDWRMQRHLVTLLTVLN